MTTPTDKLGTHPNDPPKKPPQSGTGVVTQTQQKTAPRIGDQELQALARINRALTEFDDDTVFRMLNWLNCRHGYFEKLQAVRAKELGQLKPGETDARD